VIICNMQNLQRNAPDLCPEDEEAEDDTFGFVKPDIDPSAKKDKVTNQSSPVTRVGEASDDVLVFDEDGQVAEASADLTAIQATSHSRLRRATGKKSRRKKPSQKYNPSEPILITMDSFGIPRNVETRFLKHYLCSEAEAKRGMKIEFGDLKGMNAKGLPEQPDFHNCGVYLIGYITEFARDPDRFVSRVLQREVDEEKDFADFDPSAKRAEIRSRLLALQEEQEAQYKIDKKARVAAKKAQAGPLAAAAARTAATPAFARQPDAAPTSPAQAPPKSSPPEKQPAEGARDVPKEVSASAASRASILPNSSPPALPKDTIRKKGDDDDDNDDEMQDFPDQEVPSDPSPPRYGLNRDLLSGLESQLQVGDGEGMDDDDEYEDEVENNVPAPHDNLFDAVDSPGDKKKADIDLGHEETPETVIPESQEIVVLDSQDAVPAPQANRSKHTYFSD